MPQPDTYALSLLLMILSMFCWGSWANCLKMCPGYKFQLFYWDYVVGLVIAATGWGLTLGSLGGSGRHLIDDLMHADSSHILLALMGGAVFNVANLLLVAAIDIAGLAVAFPIGIGLALVIGAVSSYVIRPAGNPTLLFVGIGLVVLAIALDALAYRLREAGHRAISSRGISISLIAGVLMGCFYPFVSQSMRGDRAVGPYSAVVLFAIGVLLCSVPVNALLMKHPLDGGMEISMCGFRAAPMKWHGWGVLGGAIWCTSALANFLASEAHLVGPAVSYSIGQGATMVSAGWGVVVWKEFSKASPRSKWSLAWIFIFFLLGLAAIAIAPLFP